MRGEYRWCAHSCIGWVGLFAFVGSFVEMDHAVENLVVRGHAASQVVVVHAGQVVVNQGHLDASKKGTQ